MSKPWPLWKVLALAILLVAPSYIIFVANVFNPDLAYFVRSSIEPHLDVAPEPESEGFEFDPNADPNEIAEQFANEAQHLSGDDFTRSFDVVAEVRADHSVVVTETITQVFRTDRHGIERDIPYDYADMGSKLITYLSVATSPGTPDDLEVTDLNGAIRARIGDPDVTVTNAHTYRLQYLIEDIVLIENDWARVPLDAITDWSQDVDELTYTVIGPTEAIDFTCYVGEFRGTDNCQQITAESGKVVARHENLPANNAFTIDVVFPSDAFDDAATTDRSVLIVWAIAAVVLMYAGLFWAYARSIRRSRRDLTEAAQGIEQTFVGEMATDLPGRRGNGSIPPPPPGSSSQLLPAQYADRMVPIEFVPPLNLDPACLLRLKEGAGVDVRRMLAATLVDLAADGVIALERTDDDWIVRRVHQPPRAVKPYEYTLLDALLGADKDEQILSTRVSDMALKTKTYVKEVDAYLASLGLFTGKRMSATTKGANSKLAYIFGIGVTVVIGSLIAFGLTLVFPFHPARVMLLGAIVGGALVLRDRIVDDGNNGRYTTRGKAAALRARGFERFFTESEAIHAQAAERSGLMREYMGYAVALGHVDTWVSAMPSGQLDAWVGSGLGNPLLYGTFYRQRIFSRAVARTYSSSSSRSGGFSSGGFSGGGGGFGGGGGGSW